MSPWVDAAKLFLEAKEKERASQPVTQNGCSDMGFSSLERDLSELQPAWSFKTFFCSMTESKTNKHCSRNANKVKSHYKSV
mmetsp:Transcript_24393/g.36184  ORF Transcript_24393/g.36184 Transcript_24393/m.36184 type:complete len:81 (-) Transcript_24393:1306-1548(-)